MRTGTRIVLYNLGDSSVTPLPPNTCAKTREVITPDVWLYKNLFLEPGLEAILEACLEKLKIYFNVYKFMHGEK